MQPYQKRGKVKAARKANVRRMSKARKRSKRWTPFDYLTFERVLRSLPHYHRGGTITGRFQRFPQYDPVKIAESRTKPFDGPVKVITISTPMISQDLRSLERRIMAHIHEKEALREFLLGEDKDTDE